MSTKPLAHQVMPGAADAESSTAATGAVRARDSLFHWCGTADAVRVAPDPSQKRLLLDAYFEQVAEETIAPAARFFAGAFIPLEDGKPGGLDWNIVAQAVGDLARIDLDEVRERCSQAGDLGDVAAEAFAGRLPSGIAVSEVSVWGETVAFATAPARVQSLLRDMFARLSSMEARYLVNLISGELDLGIAPAQVEAAVAARFTSVAARRPDRRKNNGPHSGPDQRRPWR